MCRNPQITGPMAVRHPHRCRSELQHQALAEHKHRGRGPHEELVTGPVGSGPLLVITVGGIGGMTLGMRREARITPLTP